MADKTRPKAETPRTDEPKKPNVGMWIGAGIGAGIGSAAVAAALLYATRTGKKRNPAED